MENQVFVIAIGKAGVEDGTEYIGGSLIIAPSGKILAKAQSAGDELIVAAINLDDVIDLRKQWNFLADRRPEEYHQIVTK
jgi:predicted amidohydrolase